MYLLLSILGPIGVITLLRLVLSLKQSGFDFSLLNPLVWVRNGYLWQRKMRWQRKYNKDPLHNLSDPLEVAGVLVAGTLLALGPKAAGNKNEVNRVLQSELNCSEDQAQQLMIASQFLLGKRRNIKGEIGRILAPARKQFTVAKARSIEKMMRSVITLSEEHDNYAARKTLTEYRHQFPADTFERSLH